MCPFARLWCSHFPLCLHYRLLYPALSFSFKFNNLPAVCFSRDSPAPMAHRQTAESVGNLTQHKLHCEAEVSESVGCIYTDRATVKMWKPCISSHRLQHMWELCVRWAAIIAKKTPKTKYRFCGLFRHCLYENGLHRTVSRLSSDSESKVLWKVWGHSDPVGLILCKMDKKKPEPLWLKVVCSLKDSVFDCYYTKLCWRTMSRCSQRAFSYCTEHTLLLFQSIFRFPLFSQYH